MTWMHILFLSVNNFIDIGMYYDKSQFWPDVLEYIVVFFFLQIFSYQLVKFACDVHIEISFLRNDCQVLYVMF